MQKIVNAAMKAKPETEVWTYTVKAIGRKALKSWPQAPRGHGLA